MLLDDVKTSGGHASFRSVTRQRKDSHASYKIVASESDYESTPGHLQMASSSDYDLTPAELIPNGMGTPDNMQSHS